MLFVAYDYAVSIAGQDIALPLKLPISHATDEGSPLSRGEDQGRAASVFGVSDCHDAWQVAGYLDAVTAVAVAVTALPPVGMRHKLYLMAGERMPAAADDSFAAWWLLAR